MSYIIANVVLEILALIEVGLVMFGVFYADVRKNKKSIFGAFGIVILLCFIKILESYNSTTFLWSLSISFPLIIYIVFVRESMGRKIAMYLCSMTYVSLPYCCIDLICSSVLGISHNNLEKSYEYRILRSIISILIVIIIIVLLKRQSEFKKLIKELPTKYFIIGSICALAGGFVQGFVEDVNEIYIGNEFRFLVVISLAIVIIVLYALGIIIAVINSKKNIYKKENKMKDEYLELSKKYVQLIKKNARETRKIQHDIKNHMTIMKSYIESENYNKLENYFCSFENHVEKIYHKMATVNNEVVDAIITDYLNRREMDGIDLSIEGQLPTAIKISDFDLCTLFSNLMSNSIEACNRIEKKEKYIHLEIRKTEQGVVIEITNSVEEPVEVKKLGKITSKKDKMRHGYGIQNIIDVVKKNHGEIFFENIEDAFRIRIIFLL